MNNLFKLFVVMLVLALPLVATPYLLTLLGYVGISAIAALGLVLLTGVGGLTSFGQAAFVGIGAYATAWLTTTQGASPWLGLVLALALSGGVAMLLGAATLRLGGHLLPLSTIAWGLAIFFLFGNLEILHRHDGIADIPPVSLGGHRLASGTAGFYLVWAALGGALLLCANLLDSRQGRAIRSLRGGTALAQSLGIDPFRIRLVVFVLSALLAGLSGWLLAHVQRFISPTLFDVGPGIDLLFMALLGGAGHILGAVLGAALVTFGHDALQDLLPHLTRASGPLEITVFGCVFIAVLQYARGGLIPALLRVLPRRTQPLPAAAGALGRRTLPPAGQPLLVLDGVTRRFGGLVAVDRIGFSVNGGEILGLIGPNGAGKSTLFNLISGADRADSGRIRLAGQDIARLPARRIAALGLARSFQHVRLRPGMSLLENVMLGAHLRLSAGLVRAALRLDRAEERRARAVAMDCLRRVGLGAAPHDTAGSLPLGRQRVLELARALASDPLMIILDEPAAGLRRQEKADLAALLRDLRGEGMTILLVEHDMEFVMSLVDRVVVMAFGQRIAEGGPAEVRADPGVQAAYLGTAG